MKFLRDKAHCKHDAKEDFAVIISNQTITTSGTDEWETVSFNIDYPSGFNSANSIVVAIGKSTDGSAWDEYNYGEDGNFHWVETSVTLASKINLHVSHKTTLEDFDLYYKIVLMKL